MDHDSHCAGMNIRLQIISLISELHRLLVEHDSTKNYYTFLKTSDSKDDYDSLGHLDMENELLAQGMTENIKMLITCTVL